MQPHRDRRPGAAIDPVDARQANRKKTNLRVLLASMAIAVALGVVLVSTFWRTTTTAIDYSSGGKRGEQGPTPTEATPNTVAPPPAEPKPATP